MRKNESKGYFRITSSWYLPHFHVVREDKETTKVRIVYDSVAIYGGYPYTDSHIRQLSCGPGSRSDGNLRLEVIPL